MTEIISSSHHTLTNEQLKDLQQHLCGLPSQQPVNESNVQSDVEWTLDPGNNILHGRCPSIEKIVFSKWIFLFFPMLWAFTYIASLSGIHWFSSLVFLFMSLCTTLWSAAVLFSLNRAMIPHIVRSFDTWVKIGTGLMWSIYIALYFIIIEIRSRGHLQYLYVSMIWTIGGVINAVLFMAVVSSVDGIHQWGRKGKIMAIFAPTVILIVGYVFFLFFAEEAGMPEIVIDIPGFGDYAAISLRDRLTNSYYVLSLFLVKQALNTWRKKDQCVIIKCSPFIKWEEPTLQEPKTEVSTSQNEGNDQNVAEMTAGISSQNILDHSVEL